MFDPSQTFVGSGLWFAPPLVYKAVEISSPYIPPSAPIEPEYSIAGRAETSRFVDVMKRERSPFIIKQRVLTAYASKIFEVARILKESGFGIILCPLRGARLPGMQADVICQTQSFRAFDGTDLSRGTNDHRILVVLRQLIAEMTRTDDTRRIAALDTAIGGDSCREFTRLLRQLNDESKEPWHVHFHLLHEEGRPPTRANQAYGYQSATLKISISYHAVRSLLIEDEASLLGYGVARGGGESRVVRYQKDGQVLLIEDDKATLFRSAPLDETVISLVAREIMNIIQSQPDLVPIDLDFWHPDP
jgi:hypothetical protein